MSQKKEAQGAKTPNDIDEIVQIIAKIAKFRGVRFEADERKVKLYRSGSSERSAGSGSEEDDEHLRYG